MRTSLIWLVLGILCVGGAIGLRRHRENLAAERLQAEQAARSESPVSSTVEAPVVATPPDSPTRAPVPPAPELSSTSAVVEAQPDGTRLIDRRFVLAGQGTPADPFRPTWDLLLSAQEIYDPAQGRWALPPRLDLIAGATVQIIGHMTTPVHAQVTDRLLLTWAPLDACHGQDVAPCQGIEVQLDQPVDYDPHSKTVLTIVGRFALDPRRELGWKSTVYRLDHARIVAFEDPRTR
ncbi:MAG: hypothetical protein H0X45_07515 [Planctomycetes bacterium]|nr:hypothetical protein [Planctomycetota bacterium]